MQHSPWEAKNVPTFQEMFAFYGTEGLYPCPKERLLNPNMSRTNPIRTFTFYFFETILCSPPTYTYTSMKLIPLNFPD